MQDKNSIYDIDIDDIDGLLQKRFEAPEQTEDEVTTPDTSEMEDTGDDASISFQSLADDDQYMFRLRKYGEDNPNSMGSQQENESNYDYVRRFLHHTREFEFNTIDLGQQVDYLRTADKNKRENFGYLYNKIDKTPAFYEDGGTGTLNAIIEFGGAIAFDPLSYLGFGTGFVARQMASKAVVQAFKVGGKKAAEEELKKYAVKKSLKTGAGKVAAAGLTAEAGVGVVQDLGVQETEILSKKGSIDGEEVPEGYDFVRAGFTGAFGLGLGVLGYRASGGIGIDAIRKSAKAQMITRKKVEQAYKNRTRKEQAELARELSDDATKDTVNGIFDLDEGRRVLDELGDNKNKELTDVEFNLELMKRVGGVVTNVVSDLASTGQLVKMIDEDSKAMEVIGDVFKKRLKAEKAVKGKSAGDIAEATKDLLTGEGNILGKLDLEDKAFDDALDRAISRAGLTVEQFTNAMGATYSNAGSFLSTASQVGKIMKRLGRLDPELEKILKQASSADKVAGPMSKAVDLMRRVDRERRALMVSQVATTVRNIATGAVRLTMETASDAMESAIYQLGRGAEAATTGNKAIGKGNIGDVFRDSFGKLNRLARVTNTQSLADDLLKHNRKLAGRIDRTLQEVSDDETLSAFSRQMNTLNVAQDQFFRKGIFVNSIDKKLRRAGIIVDNPVGANQFKSLDEFVVAGKQLPSKVMADSIEEALEFTFTKMPDGNTLGAKFIKFTEAVGPFGGPIGTAAFPFARFMVNAIKFQYDFSLANAAGGIYRAFSSRHYSKLAKAAKTVEEKGKLNKKALAQMKEAREDIAQGVVGTAALAAAVKYRQENQDVKFYEYRADDGTIGDLRPFFPLAPYLAIADAIVKVTNKEQFNVKEVISTVAGVQARTGTSSFILENFGETFIAPLQEDGIGTPTTERVAELMGGYVGSLAGGFLTPARLVRDIQASYDTEAAVLRDAKPTNGIGTDERFYSALKNVIVKDLPELSKQLPALESPTREDDIYRMSAISGQIGMPRKEAVRNTVENEIARLGIERYTLGAKTGDKTADSFMNKRLGAIIEKDMGEFIESTYYQGLPDSKKRAGFNNRLIKYREMAQRLGSFDATKEAANKGVGYTSFDRAKYGRLTKNQTRLVDEYYVEKYGKSVLEMVKEEPDTNHYRLATELGRYLNKQF